MAEPSGEEVSVDAAWAMQAGRYAEVYEQLLQATRSPQGLALTKHAPAPPRPRPLLFEFSKLIQIQIFILIILPYFFFFRLDSFPDGEKSLCLQPDLNPGPARSPLLCAASSPFPV